MPPSASCRHGRSNSQLSALCRRGHPRFCALGLTAAVADSFAQLSRATGGAFFSANRGDAAIEQLKMILTSEFGNLDFDRRVLVAQLDDRERSIAELATLLAAPRMAVAAAISRLERRDLLSQ